METYDPLLTTAQRLTVSGLRRSSVTNKGFTWGGAEWEVWSEGGELSRNGS